MIEPITSQEMTHKFAAMHDLVGRGLRGNLVKRIIADNCRRNDCPVSEVLSKHRERPAVWVRQDCMLEIYERTNMSLPQIGRIFDRDHTTVLWGIRRARERRAKGAEGLL